MKNCSRCGKPIMEGYKFCNVCGQPVEESGEVPALVETRPYSEFCRGATPALRVLTGERGGHCVSVHEKLSLGRGEADFDCRDGAVSSIHASVSSDGGRLYLEDNGSLNGVLVRIHGEWFLHDHDIIQAGGTYFLYEELHIESYVGEDRTEFYGSPERGYRFRLVEVLKNGLRGRAMVDRGEGVDVGRQKGGFAFVDDEYMDLRHFTVNDGKLVDHDSLNGTFVQVHGRTELEIGDQFFIGRTLFEVAG